MKSQLPPLETIIKEAVTSVIKPSLSSSRPALAEAVIASVQPVIDRSEVTSVTTKENHEKIYKQHVDAFNRLSSKLDTVPASDANNPFNSEFRRLKGEETDNANSVKLHELFWANSGDLNSEIRADSVPFMRLSRDWGTFDRWQLDFRACAMSAKEGWALLYLDPWKNKFFNVFIEGNTLNVPLMAIPVLVLDTHNHAWWFDYPNNKIEYVNKMMREVNWSVVEMRMLCAEMAKLSQIYSIVPAVTSSDLFSGIDGGGVQNLPPVMPPVQVSAMGATGFFAENTTAARKSSEK